MTTRYNFQREAVAALRGLGATDTNDGYYALQLETRAGRLRLEVWNDSVVTRFDDVAKARTLLGSTNQRLNPFSGKWNFHYDHPRHDALDHFLGELRSIL